MRPGAHGLAIVPRLVPERPPRHDGPETAAISGLTMAVGPVEIARAWLEAAAIGIGEALDAVEAAFGRADGVVAGGGALHASPAWTRIVADALGRPFRLSPHPEATLRGAALLVLERIGAIDDAVDSIGFWRDLLDLKHICFFFDYPGLTREDMNEQTYYIEKLYEAVCLRVEGKGAEPSRVVCQKPSAAN